MLVSIIVAMSWNGVIGRDGDLPWRLPDDLSRFKELTTGHTIIMGRTTWDSIGRPLPDRRSIVISRDPHLEIEGVHTARSLTRALDIAREHGETEAFIIGGAAIYGMALPLADRAYVTVVQADVEGDTYFPAYDVGEWEVMSVADHPADDRHEYRMSFMRWDRRRTARRTEAGENPCVLDG